MSIVTKGELNDDIGLSGGNEMFLPNEPHL